MNRDYDCLFKFVIIGDSGVGKSSLLLRFADDSFNDTYLTTIGVDFRFRTLTVDGQNLKLQIWDTAGQERFRTITNAYYKSADGIILVYDTTSQASLENIQNYWMKEVESYAEDGVEIILIGNKSDLKNEQSVQRETAQAFAKSKGMGYCECSAKTAEGVTEAFLSLTRALLEKSFSRKQAIENGSSKIPGGRPKKENNSKQLEILKEKKDDLGNCCNL